MNFGEFLTWGAGLAVVGVLTRPVWDTIEETISGFRRNGA